MKFIKKNNVFFMSVVCLLLIASINVTYSKFTYSKELNGQLVTIGLPTLYETLTSKSYTLDTNVDFGSASSNTNGIGLMMRNGTQNDEYPIVYYRGDISNNNVIFADFCWLIVRTTETGGIKLIYNGSVNVDGSCNNYSGVGGESANINYLDASIEKAKFNLQYNQPVYIGYMYNDANKFLDIMTGEFDVDGYLTHLSDNSIDSATGRHIQNLKDSNVKIILDDWYKGNIENKFEESLLEDAIWCNDRNVISENYGIENFTYNGFFTFAAYTRLYENANTTPSLICARNIDKFTVDTTNGNGDLDYPIGLLTADEINLAGQLWHSFQTTYLIILEDMFWTLSPVGFFEGDSDLFYVRYGELQQIGAPNELGIRPSISLSNNVTIADGDGSFEKPYVIGYN